MFLNFSSNFHFMGLVVDLKREDRCIINDMLLNGIGIQVQSSKFLVKYNSFTYQGKIQDFMSTSVLSRTWDLGVMLSQSKHALAIASYHYSWGIRVKLLTTKAF